MENGWNPMDPSQLVVGFWKSSLTILLFQNEIPLLFCGFKLKFPKRKENSYGTANIHVSQRHFMIITNTTSYIFRYKKDQLLVLSFAVYIKPIR